MSLPLTRPPIFSTDADMPEWVERVRAREHGNMVRAGVGATIEARSIHTGDWQPVMLPGGGVSFANVVERDVVLGWVLK